MLRPIPAAYTPFPQRGLRSRLSLHSNNHSQHTTHYQAAAATAAAAAASLAQTYPLTFTFQNLGPELARARAKTLSAVIVRRPSTRIHTYTHAITHAGTSLPQR